MHQNTKLVLIISSIVAAVGGLTALGVTYAKFQKDQGVVNSTTLGAELAALRDKEEAEEVGEDITFTPVSEIFPPSDEEMAQAIGEVAPEDEAPEEKPTPKKKKGATQNDKPSDT